MTFIVKGFWVNYTTAFRFVKRYCEKKLNFDNDSRVLSDSTAKSPQLAKTIAEVLLIDEVFVAGDDEFQKKAGLLITEKIQSGITVVMVTHDMGVVNHLCTRVIQIEHGISLPELSVQKTIERYLQQHRMS